MSPVAVNRYERDRRNRAAAIAIHCLGCRHAADMGTRYGEAASGFIEVHHLTRCLNWKPGTLSTRLPTSCLSVLKVIPDRVMRHADGALAVPDGGAGLGRLRDSGRLLETVRDEMQARTDYDFGGFRRHGVRLFLTATLTLPSALKSSGIGVASFLWLVLADCWLHLGVRVTAIATAYFRLENCGPRSR